MSENPRPNKSLSAKKRRAKRTFKKRRLLRLSKLRRPSKTGRKLSRKRLLSGRRKQRSGRAHSVSTGKRTRDRVLYQLNPDFRYFNELQALVLKSSPEETRDLSRKLASAGNIKLALVSGVFMPSSARLASYDFPADLFIVSDNISKKKLNKVVRSLEAEVGKEIRYSVMDRAEFDYRHGMFDRFIRVVLDAPHEKIINKIGI